ncbi:hypothetical protein OKJ48_01790 [Streptomyces kunmingensis]|uniref:Secreted protein n=1 Tax=Streptomyces kunmingensis TaxID=68225 RepID=A0ABU6C2Q8_9ACTN|nr:hypothetical protein [Streptomyces kunmingensis]MEB3958994.1 hypothetical protein [Streptomyces kunmingensis]
MRTGLKITAYAATLAAAFGTAYGVGTGTTPITTQERPAPGHGAHEDVEEAGPAFGGLQISERGYTLDLERDRLPGRTGTLRFTIRKDAGGAPVTSYKKEHGKELHLIVTSRDLTAYRHLHPVRAADGTWSTPVSLPEAGDYQVFADFTPRGEDEGLTLGTGLGVAGRYAPAPLPAPAATARVAGGYEVRIEGGLEPGAASELTLRVSRNGRPVTDLEPYLGAYGHLVALRSGDLAYLHVHPHDGRPGPGVSFTATAPSAGTYRLFLDFKHDGEVRTAAFTVHAA